MPILIGMSILVKAVPAKAPKTSTSGQVALLYAALLVIMAVAQLFSFEDFLVYLNDLFASQTTVAYLTGSLLIVAQVFALPFLLRMTISPAFRALSMALGWLVAVAWFALSLYIVVSRAPVETIGFLGTVVNLIPGWWAVCVSFAFIILAAWSSWGLWPGKR